MMDRIRPVGEPQPADTGVSTNRFRLAARAGEKASPGFCGVIDVDHSGWSIVNRLADFRRTGLGMIGLRQDMNL